MPDRKGQWYKRLLTLFATFYESKTERTNFWIMFICFTFVKWAFLYFQLLLDLI